MLCHSWLKGSPFCRGFKSRMPWMKVLKYPFQGFKKRPALVSPERLFGNGLLWSFGFQSLRSKWQSPLGTPASCGVLGGF